MKRSQREAAMRGSRHLLRLALPAIRSTGPFEGAEILEEVPAELRFPLWRAYRNVVSWALTAPGEHPGLFPPGAADDLRSFLRLGQVPEGVREALRVVCDLLDDPVATDPRRVSAACESMAEWAERQGSAPATALRFMQAAGMCVPNDPRIAYRTGSLARRQAIWDIADLWFRHASTVGRRSRDWEAHATAYLALGNSYYQQGRYATARREHLKALRVGKRHGLREIQGRAYHDLFAVAIEMGDMVNAETYAHRSFQAYGPSHPNIPTLAHDIAYFWNTRGHYLRALPVLQALLPHFVQPQDRIRVLGAIGRAAGCGEQRAVFQAAWTEVGRLAPGLEGASSLPASLLQLTYGAVGMSEWELAEAGAEYARRTALDREEADVVAEAERTIVMIRTRETPATRIGNRMDQALEEQAETLARELVASLEGQIAGVR
ncbi:MAG TPA: hypothetical protein VHG28_01375 [Longimicrobiaceae bacterium]|nr:hypothetical protein [Longimicrobiaceae bacterium]